MTHITARNKLVLFLMAMTVCYVPGLGVAAQGQYPLVDTSQQTCFNVAASMQCPAPGEDFYGQDAQFAGNQAFYTDNGDGTVTDNVTGLVWQQSPDTDGDGDIDADDQMTLDAAQSYCHELDFAGLSDWRLPSIKELYSLYNASGTDPRPDATDSTGLVPFIDTNFFDFTYGDIDAGDRIIDVQYVSSTQYVAGDYVFGVNFADGRIKGYPLSRGDEQKTFYVQCVRGDDYGYNDFVDNEDGTITDQATGLMWSQHDSDQGLNWQEALAWVQQMNDSNHLGYSDWRLPNIKELQSIVDYSRSPDTTNSAAIDALFNSTQIINEADETDYPFYWSGTTHKRFDGSGASGMYVAFGRSLGYMFGSWSDVHGAGSQRSDPKEGDPDDYPFGFGPQGDAIRIYNYVRLVRDAEDPQPQQQGSIVPVLWLLLSE